MKLKVRTCGRARAPSVHTVSDVRTELGLCLENDNVQSVCTNEQLLDVEAGVLYSSGLPFSSFGN